MKRVCTIAVRAGSKGVPGKNWKEINGIPLFAHSVLAARDSNLFSSIVVTSDAPEVQKMASKYGATHIVERPLELSSDRAGKIPAIVHAVLHVEKALNFVFDTVVDLDATSPLRNRNDIIGAISLLETTAADSVITGSEARRSPYFNLVERDKTTGIWGTSKQSPSEMLRRQDVPKTFDMNASIYVWRRNSLIENPKVFYDSTQLYEMPQERSLDIDSEFDLRIVKWIMESRKS